MSLHKAHPIAATWPMMTDAEIESLAKDIEKHGQLEPIWLFENKILDGRNRYAACEKLGIMPKLQTYSGDDPAGFAFAKNEERRHLNKAQRACLAAELKPFFEKQAKERQRESGGDVRRKTVPQKMEEPKKAREANSMAGKKTGTNGTYVNHAEKIKKEAPEVFESMKAGKLSMQDALKETRKIPKEPWKEDETERKSWAEDGWAVVANRERDKNLIQWAEKKGRAVYIGRGSLYGNPFIMGKDGDRDVVCDAYEKHYLPHKPSIETALDGLEGKVLVCHCYPERCHGDCLAKRANKE